MKKHSFIDLITNSSTSVYISPNKNSIEKTKKMLSLFLEGCGLNNNIEEYFDIYFIANPEALERVVEYGEKEASLYKKAEEYLSNKGLGMNDIKNNYIEICEALGVFYDIDYSSDFKLIIKPKNKKAIDLEEIFFNIFDVREEYDF